MVYRFYLKNHHFAIFRYLRIITMHMLRDISLYSFLCHEGNEEIWKGVLYVVQIVAVSEVSNKSQIEVFFIWIFNIIALTVTTNANRYLMNLYNNDLVKRCFLSIGSLVLKRRSCMKILFPQPQSPFFQVKLPRVTKCHAWTQCSYLFIRFGFKTIDR